MNNARRTVIACVGYAGIIGGLLAGNAALASEPGVWVRNVTGTSDGGAYVKVNASARWTSTDLVVRRYNTIPVNVAKSSLRQGALAALSRGVMHPGFQLAIAAAGFIFSEGVIYKQDDENPYAVINDFFGQYENTQRYYTKYVSSFSPSGPAPSCNQDWGQAGMPSYSSWRDALVSQTNMVSAERISEDSFCFRTSYGGSPKAVYVAASDSGNYRPVLPDVDTGLVPITDDDYQDIDPHIPVDIVQDLYDSNYPIPQWQEAISVIGQPASDVASSGQLMPEVANAVGQWGSNMDSASKGDQPQYPDQPDTGRTPEEELIDRELDDRDEPIPPFEEPEINWQTEVLDLPAFNSGIGSGSCPGSRSIPLPMGGSMTIDYQPACDLATMVRPALIGVCGMIALLIVVRARGGA